MGRVEAAGTTGAEFLSIEVAADSAAMAAGVAGSQGSASLDWNPAGILGQEYPSIAFTHFPSLAEISYEQLEGIYPGWLGGSTAIRMLYSRINDFMKIEFGEERGILDNHDLLVQLAYARPLGSDLEAGVAIKIFESALAGYHRQGAALDLGMRYQTGWNPLVLGMALQNLGTMNAFKTRTAPLPVMLMLGVSLEFPVLVRQKLKMLADWHYLMIGQEEAVPTLGLEYNLYDVLRLRGGYRFSNELGKLSVGAGLRLGKLGLDYAYQPFAELGDNHRLTLAYFFQPLGGRPANLVSRLAPKPRKMMGKSLLSMKQDVTALTVLPRQYEAKVGFIPPRMITKVSHWNLIIKNRKGKIVRKFQGAKNVPQEILWDGRDDKGKRLDEAEHFKFVFRAENDDYLSHTFKVYSSHTLLHLPPVLKLQFRDGSRLEPEVRFHFGTCPLVQNWQLSLWDFKTQKIVARFMQAGSFPPAWVWDGKTRDGKTAVSSRAYKYGIEVTYVDQFKVLISEKIKPIAAKKVEAPAGYAGILIPGILFDFDRAELKPEMRDKIMMAAEVMRRYRGQAEAVCEGHADEKGSEEYNQELSECRAHMVAKYLAKQSGVEKKNLSVAGYGKSRPRSTRRTSNDRARNRRVEIRIFIPDLK